MTKITSDLLLRSIRANPRVGSADLCKRLGVNRSTLSRSLEGLDDQILRLGNARRARYAIKRPLRGSLEPIPVYSLNQSGQGDEVGLLNLVTPNGVALTLNQPLPWPMVELMQDGWFEGLPYPIVDMRPQGFLGRQFARHYAQEVGVSDNPELWADEDVLYVLSRFGSDQPGNLILGEQAYRRHLSLMKFSPDRVADNQVESLYPQLAESILTTGIAGSSAAGEFPKFSVRRISSEGKPFDALVKFSGADDSPAVKRWGDLLRCEHLALEVLRESGVHSAAESRVYTSQGRTFLEVERFDRHGDFGRSPVCSLSSLNTALLGQPTANWPRLARGFEKEGWLSATEVYKVDFTWWFGQLIANTDMHEGNLAFRPGLVVAPVYDMLPMLYAPLRGGEVPGRIYNPDLPMPQERAVWILAAHHAKLFWQRCLADLQISAGFKTIGENNLRRLDELVELVD